MKQPVNVINSDPDYMMGWKSGQPVLVPKIGDGEIATFATNPLTGAVTGLVGPGGFVANYNTLVGNVQRIAMLGDSIANQNSTAVSFRAMGIVTAMLAYAGRPFAYDHTDNLAVFGSSISAILSTQIPALQAAQPTKNYGRVFISAGTNDAGLTLAELKSGLMQIFVAVKALGAIPVVWGILPRGADGSLPANKKRNQAICDWEYGLSLTGLIEYHDFNDIFADPSTAFGNCLATMMYDAVLHPSDRGAMLAGKRMAATYAALGYGPRMKFATQQSDQFDRTDNPHGVAFKTPNPLMQGGATAPTGMSTSGGTWSKVNITLDNGQTKSVPQCVLAASTTHYLYDDHTTTGAWVSTEFQPGDVIEARALVTVTSGVNINNINLQLNENNGGGGLDYLDLTTSALVGIADGDHTLYLKTPPVTIRAYNGSGNCALFAKLNIATAAGASGTAVVKAFELRVISLAA